MKKLACLIMVLMLSACSLNDSYIKNQITDELNQSSTDDPIYYTTMIKPLYSYYLPKDVGRIDSNPLSSLLIKDSVKFIMNFNPNEVVAHDYYQQNEVKLPLDAIVDETSDLYYESTGTFKGSDSRYHDYHCRITQLNENDYFLLLDMEYVNFSAVLKRVQIKPLIHSMFVMAKSFQYESSEVIAEYSLKSSSSSIKEDLEEFNEDLPQNGTLNDLFSNEGVRNE